MLALFKILDIFESRLVTCPQCTRQFELRKMVCTHCGYSLSEEERKNMNEETIRQYKKSAMIGVLVFVPLVPMVIQFGRSRLF